MDSNSLVSSASTTYNLNSVVENYIQKIADTKEVPEERDLYHRLLLIFRQYQPECMNEGNSPEPVDFEKPKSIKLSNELQLKVSIAQLQELKKILNNDLKYEIDFEVLNSLKMEYICELAILVCFYHAFQQSSSKIILENDRYFLKKISSLFKAQNWKRPKIIISTFTKLCQRLKLPKEIEENISKPLARIQVLSLQTTCLSMNLLELGFGPNLSKGSSLEEKSITTVKALIQLQGQLFRIVNSAIKKLNNTFHTYLKEAQKNIKELKIETRTSLVANSIEMTQNLASKLNFFLHYSKLRNSEAEMNCKSILDPSSTKIEMLMRTGQLLKETARIQEKIKKSEDSLSNFLEKTQEMYEMGTPHVKRHAQATRNLKINHALNLITETMHKDHMKEIFENFLLESKASKNTYYKTDDNLSFTGFYRLVTLLTKLYFELVSSPSERDKIENKINTIFNETLKNYPEWYRLLIQSYIEKMVSFYPSFLRLHRMIVRDEYAPYPYIPITEHDLKECDGKTRNDIIKELEESISMVSGYEEGVCHKGGHVNIQSFIDFNLTFIKLRAKNIFKLIYDQQDFNEWMETIDNSLQADSNPLMLLLLKRTLLHFNSIQCDLNFFKDCFEIGFNFLMPAISAGILNIKMPLEDFDTSWIFSIDKPKQRKKKSRHLSKPSLIETNSPENKKIDCPKKKPSQSFDHIHRMKI